MESLLIFNICTSFSFDFFGVPLGSLRAESKDLNLTLQKWLHSFHSIQPQENWTYRERYTSWTIRWSIFPGGKIGIPFQQCYTWGKWIWKVTRKIKTQIYRCSGFKDVLILITLNWQIPSSAALSFPCIFKIFGNSPTCSLVVSEGFGCQHFCVSLLFLDFPFYSQLNPLPELYHLN